MELNNNGNVPVRNDVLFQKNGSPEPMENDLDVEEGQRSSADDEDNSSQLDPSPSSTPPAPPNYDFRKGFADSEIFIVGNTTKKKLAMLEAKENFLLAQQQTTKLGKLKTPLELGWRRQTTVEECKLSQVQTYGKVIYFSPTGRPFSNRDKLEFHLQQQDGSNPYGFTGENFSFDKKRRIPNTAQDFITTIKSPVVNAETSPSEIKRSPRKRKPKAPLDQGEYKAMKRTKDTSEEFVSGMLHPKYPKEWEGATTTLPLEQVEGSSSGKKRRLELNNELPHGGLFQISEIHKETPGLTLLYPGGDEILRGVFGLGENKVAETKDLPSKQVAPQPPSSSSILQAETEIGKKTNSSLIPKYYGRGSGGPCGSRCREAGGRYPDLECVECRGVYHSICLENVGVNVAPNSNGFLCLKCDMMAKKPPPPPPKIFRQNPTFDHPDQHLLPQGIRLGKDTTISRVSSRRPFVSQHSYSNPKYSNLPSFEALCRPSNWFEEKIVQLPLKVFPQPGSKLGKCEQQEKAKWPERLSQYPHLTVVRPGNLSHTSNTTHGTYLAPSKPCFNINNLPNVRVNTYGKLNSEMKQVNSSSGSFNVKIPPKIPTLSGEKFKNNPESNMWDLSKILGYPQRRPPPSLFPIGYGSNVSLGEASNQLQLKQVIGMNMNSASRQPNQGNSRIFKKGKSPTREHTFAVPAIPPLPKKMWAEFNKNMAGRGMMIFPVEAAAKKVGGFWDDVIQID